ncbi:MAG TPA: hypothetical protein VFB60_10095 [Ktedonobacteraceae bacterium]|nr:hypothetical protein [Ktedonobacteraceae bacterium]
MRGKIRDKRQTNKRDMMKREVFERRRPYKRDTRSVLLLSRQIEEEQEDYTLDDGQEADTLPKK